MKSVQDLFIMEVAVNALKAKLSSELTEWEQGVIKSYTEEVEKQEGVRICDECGKLMVEGCVWGEGEHVECEECKDKSTTPEAWEEAVNNDEAYWTQWDEDMNE